MSLYQSMQSNIRQWECKIHQDIGNSNHITNVNISKNYEGKSRFFCQFCSEEEGQKGNQGNKINIAYYNIINYQQQPVENAEPRLELLMPIDASIKNNCRNTILQYLSNQERDENKVNSFINQFEQNVRFEIQAARDRAQNYFTNLQQLGQNLKDKYHEIIDCSKIKVIIDQNQEKEILNEAMYQYISARLENTANNKELDRLCKIFNDKLNLWTTDIGKTLDEITFNYTKKLTFDSKKISNIDSFERDVNACLSKVNSNSSSNNNNNAQQKKSGLFNNIGQSKYQIENLDQKAESLTSQNQQEEGFAKLSLQIAQDKFYQFIFKIESLNTNQELFVQLGLGNKDDKNSLTHYKTFFSQQQKDKCNFVLQGKDLSLPQASSNEIIVALNVCLKKNKFYFTDKLRSSKNIMQERIAFDGQSRYSMYIYSKGQVKITLLDYEITDN